MRPGIRRQAANLVYRDLSPFGAEVELDLSQPLDERHESELLELLNETGLLLFRGQSLTDADQTRVMQAFGHVLVEEGGHREISAAGNLGSTRLLFHSDLAFTFEPFKLLSLFALDLTTGTETHFASNTRVLGALPPELRSRVSQTSATTVLPPSQGERLVAYDTPPLWPQITRPTVIEHADTGAPILYISEQQTSRIEGLSREQSAELLEELFGYLYAPANVYRHSWRNGDFVIWNNIAVQHARPDQSATPRRRLRRIAVAEKTFFELCPQFSPNDQRIAAWGVGGILTLEES